MIINFIQACDELGEDTDEAMPTVQNWMKLCWHQQEYDTGSDEISKNMDWSAAGRCYDSLQEMPSFLAQERKEYTDKRNDMKLEPEKLKGNQLEAYQLVYNHYHDQAKGAPLKMVIAGTAGTGKSYLIKCLKTLLCDHLCIRAPTGVAAYNVHGHTLKFIVEHSHQWRIQRLKRSASSLSPRNSCWCILLDYR